MTGAALARLALLAAVPAAAFQSRSPLAAGRIEPRGEGGSSGRPGSGRGSSNHSNERRCLWGPYRRSSMCDVANDRWQDALQEAGLSAEGLSLYGCSVPKVPWSWVEKIQQMSHKKVHNFNFQGSYMWEYYRQILPEAVWKALNNKQPGYNSTSGDSPQGKARNWVIDFARENFSDSDLLKITDVKPGYKAMGKFDVSAPRKYYDVRDTMAITGDYDRGDAYHEYLRKFDALYYQEMAASNFTLCPGGDDAWSMRFYEAVAAGSVPVVMDEATDAGDRRLWALWDIPYRYYVLTSGDELVYRQDWVDHNTRLFIKYQTFHEGDNQPPHRHSTGQQGVPATTT